MSTLDYIVGASVQEHMDAMELRQVTKEHSDTLKYVIQRYDNKIAKMQEENDQLRRELKLANDLRENSKKNSRASRKIESHGRNQLAREMQSEARSAYRFVLSWIEHYGGESSNEFIEGIKEGMKMNMPFSTSEVMRKRFISLFEEQAHALYDKEGENALTKEAFQDIAVRVSQGLILEILSKSKAERKLKGEPLMMPDPGLRGPEEIRAAYGEGNFKAQEFITRD